MPFYWICDLVAICSSIGGDYHHLTGYQEWPQTLLGLTSQSGIHASRALVAARPLFGHAVCGANWADHWVCCFYGLVGGTPVQPKVSFCLCPAQGHLVGASKWFTVVWCLCSVQSCVCEPHYDQRFRAICARPLATQQNAQGILRPTASCQVPEAWDLGEFLMKLVMWTKTSHKAQQSVEQHFRESPG